MPAPLKIDPAEHPRIWARGASMEDAWWRFGSQELRHRYNAANTSNEAPPDFDQEAFAALSGPEKWKSITSAFSEAFLPPRGRSEIESKIKGEVVALLRSGKLLGYGYHAPREPLDLPTRIPDDLFDPRFIIWANSEIDGNGSKYFAVKVFRANSLKPLSTPRAILADVAILKKRKPGRPSMRATVAHAYTVLDAQGVIANANSDKEAADFIRKHIISKNQNAGVSTIPSHKTILKYLGERDFPNSKL